MAYNELLNPVKIKKLTFEIRKNSRYITGIEEIDFNLIDWVDEKLFQWFDESEIIKAIKDLGLCFYDLTKYNNSEVKRYHNWDEKNNFIIPEKHAVHYEYKNKTDYVRIQGIQTTKQYDLYSVLIKNDYKSGEILEQLLINKFPFLNNDMYWVVKNKSLNIKDYVTTNNVLVNFPKELQHLTISELLNNNSTDIVYDERNFKFKIYNDLKTIYFNPYDGDDNKDKMSMYMPVDAFINGDWNTIETNTKDAHTSYIESFTSSNTFDVQAKYKQLLDLINNPVVRCLKIDLSEQLKNQNV